MQIEFTIPGELPTANEIISASKSHHMKYANLKKDYTAYVMMMCQKIKPMKKVNITITWYCKDRRKDKDNIMFGQKFIFDGLVKAGVLKNDGWAQIGDVTHKFKVDKDKPRIRVELIES